MSNIPQPLARKLHRWLVNATTGNSSGSASDFWTRCAVKACVDVTVAMNDNF